MANKEIFDLAESSAPSITDVTFNGYDPSGVPVLRKTTWQTIRNLFLGTGTANDDFTVYNGTAWVKKTLAETQVILHPNALISGVWHKQLWVAGWKPTITNGCGFSPQIEMGTNKNVYDYLPFDPTDVEFAYANVPMPSDYTGGVIYGKVYWTHPATTTNFGVLWAFRGVCINNNEALDAEYGAARDLSDTGGTTNNLYITELSDAITLGGTPSANKLCHLNIYRYPPGDDDTLAVDAYLLGAMIYYPVA